MKKFKVTVFKMTQVDDYQNGCDLKHIDHGVIDSFDSTDLKDVVSTITKHYGKPSIYEDRLEVSRNETGSSEEPNEQQIEAWKNGQFKMYLSDYSFYIEQVVLTPIENKILVKIFPELENNT